MGFPDLTITSLETITAYDVVTGDYKFTLDELQNTSIAQTQDKVDMTGKGGRKLNSLKRNKAVTISGADGMVSGGLLEMQTGGMFESSAKTVDADMTFTVMTGVKVSDGVITSTGRNYDRILYAESEKNMTYTVANAPGKIATFDIGWVHRVNSIPPAAGDSVIDWSNSGGDDPSEYDPTDDPKTITTSADSYIIIGSIGSSVTGDYFAVTKSVDDGFGVMWTDYITTAENKAGDIEAKTTYRATGTLGAEIVGLYVRNNDGTLGRKYEQVLHSDLAEGTFAYWNQDNTITFYPDDIDDGTNLVVFYERRVHADQLVNYSDVFSGKATLYIDALAEDKCANIFRVQFFIPKADFNGEFSFDLGDNQTVHNFEAEALAGACGTAGQLWTFTVFGVDTGDA